jgi:hypothetical protein
MVRTAVAAVMLGTAALLPCGNLHPAYAQNPQPAPPHVEPVPVAPPSAATPPPEKIEPEPRSAPGRQEGTVVPRNVDPGIAVKPPAATQGTMPVVPPPGSPGGNPNVIPK